MRELELVSLFIIMFFVMVSMVHLAAAELHLCSFHLYLGGRWRAVMDRCTAICRGDAKRKHLIYITVTPASIRILKEGK